MALARCALKDREGPRPCKFERVDLPDVFNMGNYGAGSLVQTHNVLKGQVWPTTST